MRLPKYLVRILANPYWAGALVVAVGAISARHYLAPGIPFQGDVWPHTALAESTYDLLWRGQLPVWYLFQYCGFEGGLLYGPFFSLAVALTRLITRIDTWSAMKATLVLLHTTSGFVFFLLGLHRLRDSRSALIAALVYVLAPWHIYQVLGMGRLAVSVVYCAVPLALWGIGRGRSWGQILTFDNNALSSDSTSAYSLAVCLSFSLLGLSRRRSWLTAE